MEKEEFKNLQEKKEVEEVKPEEVEVEEKEKKAEAPRVEPQMDDYLMFFEMLRRLKKDEAAVPTRTPKNFLEQIKFYVSGTTYRVYFYIKDAWKKIYDSSATTSFTSRVRAYLTADQTVASVADDVVLFDAEDYDGDSEFAASTFTAKAAGYYQVNAQISWEMTEADKQYLIRIYKNDAEYACAPFESSHATAMACVISDIIYLAIDDYIKIQAQHNGDAAADVDGGTTKTFVSIHRLS